MSTLPVVVNPSARAGAARRDVDTALDALARLGARPVDVAADDAAGTRDRIAELVQSQTERIIVLGGDGMVQLAAGVLAGTGVALGVIPSGTGNDFAGSLGLPTDIGAAAARAMGPTRAVDLIRIEAPDADAMWAATVATIGFAADVNERANRMARPRGPSRYSIATILELPGLAPRHVTIGVDGHDHTVDATLVAVANTTSFGGGMQIAPLARCDDGILDVTVVGAVGRLRLLRFFRRVFDGTHLELDDVMALTGASITLVCPGARLWADGEPVGDVLDDRPVSLRAAPGALVVAAGSGSIDEG